MSCERICMSLFAEKIGIQYMSEFVSKQSRHNIVAVFSAFCFGYKLVSTVYADKLVICAGNAAVFRVPIQIDADTAIVFIPFCLCRCNVFKMSCKNTGREELPVCNRAAFFVQTLFY